MLLMAIILEMGTNGELNIKHVQFDLERRENK